MSIIQSLDQQTDEAGVNLRQLLEVVVASNQRIESELHEIEGQQSAWDAMLTTLQTEGRSLAEAVEPAVAAVQTDLASSVATLGVLEESAGAGATLADESAGELGATGAELLAEAASHMEVLASALSGVQAATEQLLAQCSTLQQSLEGTGQGLTQLFTEVQTQNSDGLTRLTEMEQELTSQYELLSIEVAETAKTAAETALNEFNSEITGPLTETLSSTLETTDSELKEGVSAFTSSSEEHLQELFTVLSGSSEAAVDFVKDTVTAQVSELCDEMVNTVISAFAEEVQLNMVTMQVGAQVTTTLAPILPELKVAESVLSVINTLTMGD